MFKNYIRSTTPSLLFLLLLLSSATFYAQVAYAFESGNLSIVVIDSDSKELTPVRVRLVNSNGHSVSLTDDAIKVMYGRNDQAEGYGVQPDSSFYVDGEFHQELAPGTYELTLSKGIEYLQQHHTLSIQTDENIERTFEMQRWIDMPERGWYSADDHIHLRRSPRENPLIHRWIAAEDIHVGALLWMGDFWTTYFAQYSWGKEGLYQEGEYILSPGQEEPRTHEIGHTISLGADKPVRFRGQYYYYDMVADSIHESNGLFGYAHQGMSFHGYRGMTLDVLRRKVDFLELLQFCVPEGPLAVDHYYHFLDLGYRLTATGGSDFPWCGKSRYIHDDPTWDAQIGNARFYTYVCGEFTFQNWMNGVKSGHTFVTSGPMLQLTINGQIPGDSIDVEPGTVLKISAKAYGHQKQVPLQSLSVIGHGEVLKEIQAGESPEDQSLLQFEFELPVEEGIWIAAGCRAGELQKAHTTPIYISAGGEGFHNPATAGYYLNLSEQYLREIGTELDQPRVPDLNRHAWRYSEGLEQRILETQNIIQKLRQKILD